ncbi:hypothetical protein [Sphingobacterium siyangense]|uniref:hypothetical protein n=1 Tax=Sphingobacterium siyangense TaxID=459529 RepID=UPI001963B88F|nr:hypothetical protein [Sphingobacterium siyangense]QRY58007.1 hypothetical protein JVX97_00560 [Sphingobacterium siyangense]
MTKREFLRNELLRGVEAKIMDSGFKLIKSKACFIKKTTFGWMKYVVTFLLDDNGWIIRPDLLARFNNVEEFFHKRSGFEKKYQKGTPTIGTSIESLGIEGITTRFNISEENDIDVNSTFLTGPIFKGMKGLILAHFVGNKNIKKLDGDYYRYYESFSDGFYLETYNNIRELVFKDIE